MGESLWPCGVWDGEVHGAPAASPLPPGAHRPGMPWEVQARLGARKLDPSGSPHPVPVPHTALAKILSDALSCPRSPLALPPNTCPPPLVAFPMPFSTHQILLLCGDSALGQTPPRRSRHAHCYPSHGAFISHWGLFPRPPPQPGALRTRRLCLLTELVAQKLQVLGD